MSTKFRNKYRVESTRLRGYNYSRNGSYFITICTKNHFCLFGEIIIDDIDTTDAIDELDASEMRVETGLRPVSTDNSNKIDNSDKTDNSNNANDLNINNVKIKLSDAGKIVHDCWFDLPNHYSNIILDEFIVMPDHIHGIIIIENNVETGLRPVSTTKKQKYGLSEFVRAFKSFSSRRINEIHKPDRSEIWQPRFHDHIIHSDNELDRIRNYIKGNPVQWVINQFNIV